MQKKNLSKIFWITLAVLFLLLAFLPRPDKTDIERPAPGSMSSVEAKKIGEVRQSPVFEVDIEYPELKLPGREEIARKVNNDIRSHADAAARSFGSEIGGMRSFSTSTITARYKVEYLNENIFSYAMNYSAYASGAAHPNNYSETYTYDLRSGGLAAMRDLFKPGSSYLETIADYARAEVLRRFADSETAEQTKWIQDGTAGRAENYRNFLIGQDGLVILFDPYQVAPYAAGTQRVVIPYAALDRFINEGGLLGLRGG